MAPFRRLRWTEREVSAGEEAKAARQRAPRRTEALMQQRAVYDCRLTLLYVKRLGRTRMRTSDTRKLKPAWFGSITGT